MPGIDLSKEKTAQFFGVDIRTVERWLSSGCPGKKTSRGFWSINSASAAEWLRQREREAALGDVVRVDESEARRRKLAAEAAREELRLAIDEGKVVAITDVRRALEKVSAAIRAKALNFPTKAAPEILQAESVAEAKDMLDGGVREMLSELSDLNALLRDKTPIVEESMGGGGRGAKSSKPAARSHRKRVGRPRKKA